MHHPLLLHLLNAVSYLAKDLADEGLRQPRFFGFELLDQLIKFLTLAMLHQQVQVRFVLKAVVKKNDGVNFFLLLFEFLNNLALRVEEDMDFNFIFYSLLQILLLDLFFVNHFKSELLVSNDLISGFYTVHISGGTSA